MALAYPTGPTKFVVTLRDEASNSATKTYVVPTSVWDPTLDLFSALATIRDAFVTSLNLNTDALIWKLSIVIAQEEDTAKIGAAGSEIENIASIVGNISGENKTTVLQIPSPVIGMFVGASGKNKNVVDLLDADLNTFIDHFQSTGGDFTVSDGEVLDDTTPMDSGKRIHRKSTKG